jgi:hypothetical protein
VPGSSGEGRLKRKLKVETKRCKVADESVVVMKSRPEKAGNGLEEKTGTTRGFVRGGRQAPKALTSCEGRKFI